MNDPKGARVAAERLGGELARRGCRLLVYGGRFIEADVVRGFVAANPASDKSILNPIGRLWIKLIALLSYLQ